MENIFETNDLSAIQTEMVCGKKAYTMDNFYKYPDKILEYLYTQPIDFMKGSQKPSFNGIHFEDMRHHVTHPGMKIITDHLSSICGQKCRFPDTFMTNVFKFKTSSFNKCKNNYWWPHIDEGYTALVYFNKLEMSGTNLYKYKNGVPKVKGMEHVSPWKSKEEWEVVHNFSSSYNKMIMFDAHYFYHGMDIWDDTFEKEYRVNQPMFFER